MKNMNIERIAKDWDRHQQGLLKHPDKRALPPKVRNDKRSLRFGGSPEDKRYAKYGTYDEDDFVYEMERIPA